MSKELKRLIDRLYDNAQGVFDIKMLGLSNKETISVLEDVDNALRKALKQAYKESGLGE